MKILKSLKHVKLETVRKVDIKVDIKDDVKIVKTIKSSKPKYSNYIKSKPNKNTTSFYKLKTIYKINENNEIIKEYTDIEECIKDLKIDKIFAIRILTGLNKIKIPYKLVYKSKYK